MAAEKYIGLSAYCYHTEHKAKCDLSNQAEQRSAAFAKQFFRGNSMKQQTITLLFLMLFMHASHADYYYSGSNRIDTYDPVSGLYYKAVTNNKEERGFLSKGPVDSVVNVALLNPATGATSLLFKSNLQGAIITILYEAAFKDGVIEFYGDDSRYFIKNNAGLTKRPPRNKILIVVREKDDKHTLYIIDKDGKNPEVVATIPQNTDWHIDVKNSKLRIVHQTGGVPKIESHDW